MKILESEYQDLIRNGQASTRLLDSLQSEFQAKTIYLYGALGRSARLLIQRLASAGIRIEGGFDRRAGDTVSDMGFPVRTSAHVAELSAGDVLIAAAGSAELFESMREEVIGFTKAHCPQIVDGRKLIYVLQNLHCAALAREGKYEDLMTCISYHTKPFKCEYFKRATERLAMMEVPQQIKSEGASFNSVGYLVGEWCNLKCAQCCEAVPYLDSKQMVSVEEIVSDLRKLTASIRFLHRLDIVGGEPFAHKEIVGIIEEVKKLPGIGYIAVFTNGTIMPSDELCDALISERIIVTNSDYSQSLDDGKRAKIARTVKKLRSRGVKVIQITDRYWFDLINFKPNGANDRILQKNYADCFLESCRRLYRGTLYHCAFQANGIKLGLIPRVNVVDLGQGSAEEVSERLENFEHEKFIDSCHYCALPIGAKETVAALQLKNGEIPVIKK